jgi:hypothetical protein
MNVVTELYLILFSLKIIDIFVDISDDFIREFSPPTTLLPAHVAVLPGERRVTRRDSRVATEFTPVF